MKYLIKKDNVKRQLFNQFESKNNILKSITYSENLLKSIQWKSAEAVKKLEYCSSKTKVRNRCISTGRSHGVISEFKLSRIALKKYVSNKNGFGIKRA